MKPDLFTINGIPELKPGTLLDQLPSPNQKVLALTWKQPYASLMLHGKIETRKWKTNYRGWVLICAGLSEYTDSQLRSIAGATQRDRIFTALDYRTQPLGKAIAIGRLSDCRPMQPEDADKCFVAFNPDLYCHIYEDVRPIEPIPWKGKQGWATVPQEVLNQIIIKQ
jgi:hypothetical protein